LSATTLRIVPWIDPVIDTLGHDARSLYAELFYLPTLGPSTLFLLRRLVAMLERQPDGFELSVGEIARSLGLGDRESRNSPTWRSFCRLIQFDLARDLETEGDEERPGLAVRRLVPPINQRHVRRLPEHLQSLHDEWAQARLTEPALEPARRNARRLASSLLAAGQDVSTVEHTLYGAGFPPVVCGESAQWALAQFRGEPPLAVPA
jgi:hypothetical protein